MKIQDVQGALRMDQCYEDLHNFRIDVFSGMRCYCGEMRVERCRCACGHEHIVQVSTKATS